MNTKSPSVLCSFNGIRMDIGPLLRRTQAMRIGPFSNQVVTDFLNRYYDFVYASNEACSGCLVGRGGKELSQAAVLMYVVLPDGTVHNSMHVRAAAQIDLLLRFFRTTIGELKTEGGDQPVKKRCLDRKHSRPINKNERIWL